MPVYSTGGTPQPLSTTDTPQFARMGIGIAADAARLLELGAAGTIGVNGTLRLTLGATNTFAGNLSTGGGNISTAGGGITAGAGGALLSSVGRIGLQGSNGQELNRRILSELTTIAAAATTDTAIQIPANAVVEAVTVRVTTAIPTAATFTVTGTTSGTTFNTAAVSTGLNSTDAGTQSCPFKNGAAQTIRITPDLTPATNAGRVRVTIYYYDVTVATS